MVKADNENVIADPEIRQMADRLRKARELAGKSKEIADETREEILEAAGTGDVTYVTESGDEVMAIVTTTPTKRIDWARYKKDHPEIDFTPYELEAKSQTRVSTSWHEPDAQNSQNQ